MKVYAVQDLARLAWLIPEYHVVQPVTNIRVYPMGDRTTTLSRYLYLE